MIQSIQLNNILNQFGSDISKCQWIGSGQNGEAYYFTSNDDKKYVIKYTNRKAEVLLHIRLKELQDKNYENTIYEHSVRIYFIGKIENTELNKYSLYDYIIIQEYVELDELVSQYWDELAYVPYDEVMNNDNGKWTEEHYKYKEVFRFIERICEQIGANDVHGENIGIALDGTIKAFDWDDTKLKNDNYDYGF